VFAEAAAARGDQLERWRLADGAPPPDDPLSYDAVISLGGAAHPDQEGAHPWLTFEKALLGELLAHGTPVLGVCLGAQLLAEAASARARANPTDVSPDDPEKRQAYRARRADRPEVGWYPVAVTADGAEDPLLGPLAPQFEAFEWHSYECPLPSGAVELARSERCLQAFRAGRTAWGIQFHAEVTLTDLHAWIDHERDPEEFERLAFDPAELRKRTRREIAGWNRLGRDLCARFLEAARTAKA
jgi:GMP synthase (glutamine-hydrolysing)